MRELKQTDIDSDPNLLWNEFVDIIAMSDFDESEKIIEAASLCFWYDSELQNGGHLQYFENQGIENSKKVSESLVTIGAKPQKKVYEKALKVWMSKVRDSIDTVEEYVSEALEGEFDELDSKYYECSPDMDYYLEKFLENHESSFFRRV